MSINDIANNAYRQDLKRISDLILLKEAKKCVIARELNVSRTTLNDYLQGVHDIPLSIYRKLEALLEALLENY